MRTTKTITEQAKQMKTVNPYARMTKKELLEVIEVLEQEVNSITQEAVKIFSSATSGMKVLKFQIEDLRTHAQN